MHAKSTICGIGKCLALGSSALHTSALQASKSVRKRALSEPTLVREGMLRAELNEKEKREQDDSHSRYVLTGVTSHGAQRNISLIIPHVRLIPLTLCTTPTVLE